jgi:hypothetical protein
MPVLKNNGTESLLLKKNEIDYDFFHEIFPKTYRSLSNSYLSNYLIYL